MTVEMTTNTDARLRRDFMHDLQYLQDLINKQAEDEKCWNPTIGDITYLQVQLRELHTSAEDLVKDIHAVMKSLKSLKSDDNRA